MRFSVIVPAYNAEAHLAVLLGSISAPPGHEVEVIVVDDASRDRTAVVATEAGCRLLRLHRNGGPAAARNAGAQLATGEILVFTDADIEFRSDTLETILRTFEAHPSAAAVVGNLCPEHPPGGVLSRYKNLYTHYTYRHCGPWISVTFTSLTAVRAEAFWRAGAMPNLYPNEDRAFGIALVQQGMGIRFVPELQVRHHHDYRLRDLLRSEFSRGRNLARITLESRHHRYSHAEEHVPKEFRHALLLVAGAWGAALLTPALGPIGALAVAGGLLGAGIALRPFLRYLRGQEGIGLAILGAPICLADLSVVALGAAVGVGQHVLGARRLLADLPPGCRGDALGVD